MKMENPLLSKLETLKVFLLFYQGTLTEREGSKTIYLLVLTSSGAVFTTLHFLLNLRIGSISQCYIAVDWKCLSGTNTLAYWGPFVCYKKMKCCEYVPWRVTFSAENIVYLYYKTSTLNEEVNRTECFPFCWCSLVARQLI